MKFNGNGGMYKGQLYELFSGNAKTGKKRLGLLNNLGPHLLVVVGNNDYNSNMRPLHHVLTKVQQ